MRRIFTALTALALALSFSLGVNPAPAAAAAFDSAYQFESAFLGTPTPLNPGDTGTFSVFFANTGTNSWVKGSSTQVNLATCLDNKTTCNVAPEEAAFASGWLSTTAYATATKDTVVPGDFSAFTYNIKVPAAQAAGTYRFNGDLVVAATLAAVHPEGYYQDAKVGGAASTSLSANPAFASANDKMNFASTTVPGSGQHTVTFTGPAGTVLSFVIVRGGDAKQASNGTYSFCDTNQDGKADFSASTRVDASVVFTAVNGVAITAATSVINQAIPASGSITVTIDSQYRDARVRVVAWEDKNANGQIELANSNGSTLCTTTTDYGTTDGNLAVSGQKIFTGPLAAFGAQSFSTTCNTGITQTSGTTATTLGLGNASSALSMFTAGTCFSVAGVQGNYLRYLYDDNDSFKINSTPVSKATFQAQLTPGDTLTINYDPNSAGTSEFDIVSNAGYSAATITAATGNFDSGTLANDVRITWTAPAANGGTVTYTTQRSFLGTTTTADTTNCPAGSVTTTTPSTPADSTFTTVGSTPLPKSEPGTFINYELANGGYCFRQVVTNPTTGVVSYSNYALVNITGAAGETTAPTSTTAQVTNSTGFASTLDTGDKLDIRFSEAMSIASNAVIRFTDSDCGAATQAGAATCAGGTTNTVGDVVCGTNATCTLTALNGSSNRQWVVTLNSNPTILTAGSTAGLQFPLVITDASGITDLAGNAWNFGSQAGGDDRLIEQP